MVLHTNEPPTSTESDLTAFSGRADCDIKLAHRVAVMLQHEIISGRLQEGCSLGTAAAIRARYNVGRWAFREALGILELRSIARMKSGPGGGVIVMEPDFVDLVDLTLIYLYANHSGPQEISEVRRSVLTAVVKLLLERPAVATQPVVADPPADLPRFLAAQTRNGALELAVEFVESVREACAASHPAPEAPQVRLTSLWHSICHQNKDAALRQLDEFLTADENLLADAWKGLPELSTRRGGTGKLAYRLALEILKDIVEHPARVGNYFGSEIEIGIRFDANGEIVRQAIRLIEDLGVFTLRRGRSGGVVLRAPDTASIAALIPHLLAQKQVPVATCFEAGRYLEDELVRLAARNAKVGGQPLSRPEIPGDPTFRDAEMVNQTIHMFAGSPLLLSIERGMGFYSYAIDAPFAESRPTTAHIFAMSQRVLEAVEKGDVEGASAANRERFNILSVRFSRPGAEPTADQA